VIGFIPVDAVGKDDEKRKASVMDLQCTLYLLSKEIIEIQDAGGMQRVRDLYCCFKSSTLFT
jgi:hypothetical protein